MIGQLHVRPDTPNRVFLVRQVVDHGDPADLQEATLDWVVFVCRTDEPFLCDDRDFTLATRVGPPWQYWSHHESLEAAMAELASPEVAEV